MTRRIIINNHTDLSDYEALSFVQSVIRNGLASNGNSYHWLTVFHPFNSALSNPPTLLVTADNADDGAHVFTLSYDHPTN